MTDTQSSVSLDEYDSIQVESITRLLRQMAWIWIAFLTFISLFLLLNFSKETKDMLGLSDAKFYFSAIMPEVGWSLISLHIFWVARGLSRNFCLFEKRARTIGYFFLVVGAPLLTYHSWQLIKRIKQFKAIANTPVQ